jgi:hypothetical protein
MLKSQPKCRICQRPMKQDEDRQYWYCYEHEVLFLRMKTVWGPDPTGKKCPKCSNELQFKGHDDIVYECSCPVCLTKWALERLIPGRIIVLESEGICAACDRPIPAGEWVNWHERGGRLMGAGVWHQDCRYYYSPPLVVPMKAPKLHKCRRCGVEFFEKEPREPCPSCGSSEVFSP